MNTLLIVNSSPRSNSVSRRLTRHVAEEWMARNPDGRSSNVTWSPTASLPDRILDSGLRHAGSRAHAGAASRRWPSPTRLIEELLAADVIVLGVPMHNFSIPAALKAWIDLITRAGKTFSYGEKGPQGLIPEGKQVLAIVSRGGAYGEGTPASRRLPSALSASHVGICRTEEPHRDRGRQAGALVPTWRSNPSTAP